MQNQCHLATLNLTAYRTCVRIVEAYNIMARTNYLNNRDMLREIHLSKCSYCSFASAADQDWDLIVHDLQDLPSSVPAAKQARAERLSRELASAVTAQQISTDDLVFRVMTWDHIPLAPVKKQEPQQNLVQDFLLELESCTDYADDCTDETEAVADQLLMVPANPVRMRVNFPPFQHWKINSAGEMRCVGKSHWRGDVETGEFCKNQGHMTDRLALMFLKLTERYGSKGNWRGYSYNDEMRGAALVQLCQVGLQFDESKSSNPFSYFTAVINNAFIRILNLEKRNQGIRDDLMEAQGLTPSFSRQLTWNQNAAGSSTGPK